MPCPNCSKSLTTKTIHTVGAGKIDVDYCPSCGGIFFDQGEVNRISQEEAEQLSKSMRETHVVRSNMNRTHLCPRCGASLKRFFGESVPDDVHVLRCPECSGTWFEADDLDRFKQAQEAKINYFRTWKLPLPSLSTVLIPVALLVILTGVTLITVEQVQKGTITNTRADEIVSKPAVVIGEDGTSATIVFTTKEPARTELIFWYDKPLGKTTLPISDELTSFHQTRIRDLTPGNTYRYQIHVVTAEQSFLTREYEFMLIYPIP